LKAKERKGRRAMDLHTGMRGGLGVPGQKSSGGFRGLFTTGGVSDGTVGGILKSEGGGGGGMGNCGSTGPTIAETGPESETLGPITSRKLENPSKRGKPLCDQGEPGSGLARGVGGGGGGGGGRISQF